MRRSEVPGDDTPTAVVPVMPTSPPVRRPGAVRRLAPWAAFGVLAASVVAGTTAWSASLRDPADPLLAATRPTLADGPPPPAVAPDPAVAADPGSGSASAATSRPRVARGPVTGTRLVAPSPAPAETVPPLPPPAADAVAAPVPAVTTTAPPPALLSPRSRCGGAESAIGGSDPVAIPGCEPATTTPSPAPVAPAG